MSAKLNKITFLHDNLRLYYMFRFIHLAITFHKETPSLMCNPDIRPMRVGLN